MYIKQFQKCLNINETISKDTNLKKLIIKKYSSKKIIQINKFCTIIIFNSMILEVST